MPAITELDRLKAKKQDAFLKKQALFKECQAIKRRIDDLYAESRQILDEKQSAHDEMVRADTIFREKKSQYDIIRDKCERIRRQNISMEERLCEASDHERKLARGYAKIIDSCRNSKSDEEMQGWYEEVIRHQDMYDFFEQRIAELCEENKTALHKIESSYPKVYADALDQAKSFFKRVKARYEAIQDELRIARRDRDSKKAELEAAQAEYNEVESEYYIELRKTSVIKKRERCMAINQS